MNRLLDLFPPYGQIEPFGFAGQVGCLTLVGLHFPCRDRLLLDPSPYAHPNSVDKRDWEGGRVSPDHTGPFLASDHAPSLSKQWFDDLLFNDLERLGQQDIYLVVNDRVTSSNVPTFCGTIRSCVMVAPSGAIFFLSLRVRLVFFFPMSIGHLTPFNVTHTPSKAEAFLVV